jgi:FKBP-type peptidyl-prolyl cis-trans isomerase
MDKKTIIAVVVGILLVFLVVGGKDLLSSMSGSSNQTSQIDQAAVINNQDTLNTQDTMSQDSTQSADQIPTSDQLETKDTVVGTGATATAGQQVTVNYTGKLLDGTTFDSSLNPGRTPFTFTLGAGQVIAGWDQGVAGMKVGGTRILVIPPALGYGAQAVGSIPANSTLIFQVELLSVK